MRLIREESSSDVYVSFDMTITSYYAFDIVEKRVYPNIEYILKDKCPDLYSKYKKLITDDNPNLPVLAAKTNKSISKRPQLYLDTDIYVASREIKKMQKLHSNILTTWYEIDNDQKRIAPDK